MTQPLPAERDIRADNGLPDASAIWVYSRLIVPVGWRAWVFVNLRVSSRSSFACLLYRPSHTLIQYKVNIYKKVVGVVGRGIVGISLYSQVYTQGVSPFILSFSEKFVGYLSFILVINRLRGCEFCG